MYELYYNRSPRPDKNTVSGSSESLEGADRSAITRVNSQDFPSPDLKTRCTFHLLLRFATSPLICFRRQCPICHEQRISSCYQNGNPPTNPYLRIHRRQAMAKTTGVSAHTIRNIAEFLCHGTTSISVISRKFH